MSNNSQNNNTDSLNEINKRVLNNISQLQIQENDLYNNLQDSTLTTDQKQKIVQKINEISQIRMNLYDSLKDSYSNYQKNVSDSRDTLGQTIAAVDILENELNQSKIKLNMIEDQKYNKLRLVEINTYYGKRYSTYARLMKTIVIMCIPVLLVSVLYNKGLLPGNIYKLIVSIIMIIGLLLIFLQIIDISNRDSMNWDEYNWYFNQDDAPSSTTDGTNFYDPWTSDTTTTCVGEECCYDGNTYDTSLNTCVPTNTTTETFDVLSKYGYNQNKNYSSNFDAIPNVSSFKN